MDDFPIIVCVRERPGFDAVPGSIAIQGSCGHRLVIGPSGLRIVVEKGARPVCAPCARKIAEASDEVEFAPLSEEQLAEIRAYDPDLEAAAEDFNRRVRGG